MSDDFFDDCEDGCEEDQENEPIRHIFSALDVDKDMELLEHLEEQNRNGCEPSEEALMSTLPPQGKGSNKRANRQAALANQVIESGKLLISEDGRAFAYQDSGGFYQPIPKVAVYLANYFDTETVSGLLTRDIHEIGERLSWSSQIWCNADDFNCCHEMVNLENGSFNMETNELMEHDARFRFTYVIHADYLRNDCNISCPVFEEFCKTSLDGDRDKRQLLLEFIGYICTDGNDGKCALFLKGQPNSGKSVISAFISKLFDPSLVSNIPLHQLGDRFFRAELAGKKLNVAGEIAGRSLSDISIFKSVTGNDRMAGEFKRENTFYFTAQCKLLFSGNTLPTTTDTDTTAAFVNRIRVLLFNNSVPPEKQDKGLLDKLWKERDSIVTLAIQAVQRLAESNYVFAMPEDSKRFLEAFKLRGNIIDAFIEDCCVLDPDAQVFNVDLYAAFEDYCAKNSLDRLSRRKFYELLSGIPKVLAKRIRMNGENRQGHVGITLKKPPKSGTLEQQE